jgi:hypothetical protein
MQNPSSFFYTRWHCAWLGLKDCGVTNVNFVSGWKLRFQEMPRRMELQAMKQKEERNLSNNRKARTQQVCVLALHGPQLPERLEDKRCVLTAEKITIRNGRHPAARLFVPICCRVHQTSYRQFVLREY